MTILALEGALGQFSAAVVRDAHVLGAKGEIGNIALERGLTIVRDVMAEARVTPGDLDRIAIGIGPGGFTGLRITISYAKSLAQAWGLPLVGVSSFDALEAGRADERSLAVVVGRPGVISVRYRIGRNVVSASGRTADVLAQLPRSKNPLAVTGAPEDVLCALAEAGYIVKAFQPASALPAVDVAHVAAGREPAVTMHDIRANYGEMPAAKVPALPKASGR